MKKFLSLVLALVMTMSLVTISAGAKDFTDDADVNYDSAVEVLSTLKVIDGYTDGSFRPETELNRGAAAKIICNMILGPTTASALSASSAPFVDVPADSVFAGYITYCAKEGIINGYADGTFRPTAPLTGYAFLKMLLGALGYDADLEGYTGANWGVNVAKQAIGIGLDDGIDGFVGTAYVNRETACQMALNTLKATMVEYDSKTSVTVNGAEVVVGGSEYKEVKSLEDKKSDETLTKDGLMQFAEKYFPKLTSNPEFDAFGRPATEWKYNKKSVGVFNDTPDLVYTEEIKGKTIYADLDADIDSFKVYENGEDHEVTIAGLTLAKKDDTKLGKQGRLTEVYYDADTESARIVMVDTFVMMVDGDYDEDAEELELTVVETDVPGDDALVRNPDLKTDILSSEDWDDLDQYKDEDIVVITVAYDKDGDDGVVKSIALAETKTAVVDEHVENESLTADGTEYKFAYAWAEWAKDNNYVVDDEYNLYFDAYGNVIYSKAVDAEAEYVYISEFAKNSHMNKKAKIEAYAYFVDGSEATIPVKKIGTATMTVADLGSGEILDDYNVALGGWFKYTTNSDGTYSLTEVAQYNDNKFTGHQITDEDTVLIDWSDEAGVTNAVRGTKATVFVVVDKNDDVEVYTGIKNVPELTAKDAADSVAAVVYDGNYADYVFVDLGDDGAYDGQNVSSDVVYFLAFEKDGTDAADNDYYRYKGLLNGEEGKIRTEYGLTYGKGLYASVKYDKDSGYISSATLVADGDKDYSVQTISGSAAKITEKKGVITIVETGDESTRTKYYMADESEIFVIDISGDVKTVSATKLADKYTDLAVGSVIYGVEKDGEHSALYVQLTVDFDAM